MISVIIITIALFLSIYFRYVPNSLETIWWNSYIFPVTLFLLVISFILLSLSNYSKKALFQKNMLAVTIVGISSIFFASKSNPSVYAMYITLSIPSLIYFLDNKNSLAKIFVIILFAICVIAVIISASRSGIISVTISLIYIFFTYYNLKFKKILLLGIPVVCLLAITLLYTKKDSSLGRYFILENTSRMIMDKPYGWGRDGFKANYMHYQADYFANNTNEEVAILADDIRHPLNEYMYIATNYGIQGLLFFIVGIITIVAFLIKYSNKESRCFLHFIILILLWSCLSYPFQVSFVMVTLLAFIPAIPYIDKLFLNGFVRNTIVLLLLLYNTYEIKAFVNNNAWNNAIKEYQNGNKDAAMKIFYKYNNYSIDKDAMLFSLATIEYNNKNYNKCIDVCIECKNYLASYDLEIILANSYMFIRDYEKALEHYTLAHNMCPNRFIPLYKQFKIYKEIGDTTKMTNMANIILSKKIKIPSRKIDIIINNTNYELQKINERNNKNIN